MQKIELVGKKFGRLTVISLSGAVKSRLKWACACECGNTKVVDGAYLRRGTIRSCGCLRAENTIEMRTTHGLANTGTYSSWLAMRRRCSSPKHPHFDRYGGRGIAVCEEWESSFPAFLADMGIRPEGMTLDRKDNALGYFKDNCRWATRSEQNANQHHPKRPGKGIKLAHDGKELTVLEWSQLLGIPVPTLHKRLQKEWPVDRVLSTDKLYANQYYRR